MLWKANIDIEFVAEASLDLAHYVSGYVMRSGRKWAKTRAFTVSFGALGSESVVCMRQVICCWEITSLRSQTLSSGQMCVCLTRGPID